MLERKTVHKHIQLGTLKLYRRFIDDVLIIIQSTDHQSIPMLQNDFSSLHPKIKLTWTKQSQICNFLDTII